MAEARIIPINTDRSGVAGEQVSAPRATKKKPAGSKPRGSKGAGSTGVENRGTTESSAPGSSAPKPSAPGEHRPERHDVEPPETLRDLGEFVTGAKADKPAADARPAAERAEERVEDRVEDRAEERTEVRARPEPPPGEDEWERKLAGALAFMRRRLTGEYEVDEFGFDAELTDALIAAPLRPLYEKWFRVEVSGMENVPDKGAALIVANHSGVIALDGAITALALLDHHPSRRHLRMLGADLVFRTPFVGALARKAGNTLACQADAERLLTSGELVGVYPEGFKGVGKPFSERYKLQRFGRGGFVSSALRTKAPIIPCSIVGAEEIYPMIGQSKFLARLLGAPYFPITPTFPLLGPLGLVPLPSKWYIEFGEPIDTAPLADRADDPMLVFNVADQVRETIQQTLYRLLMRRKSVFL